MAGTRPLLIALATLAWRDFRSAQAISANNFFLFAMLVFVMQPAGGAFLAVILGLALFFPLAADPLRFVPEERLALLPLSFKDHIVLRAGSLLLNPAAWIALPIVLVGGARYRVLGWQLLLLALLANGAAYAIAIVLRRSPRWEIDRWIPRLPGLIGTLVRKNMREQVRLLDTWVALALSLTGAVYRLAAPRPDDAALFGLTILTALALSTYAQQLFALDYADLALRYRLLPLKAWQILLAKDLAFLLLLLIVILPLQVLPGFSAGLAALAIGHYPSLWMSRPQRPWRFVAGAGLSLSILQTVALISVAVVVSRQSGRWILLPLMMWLVSFFAVCQIFGRARN